MSVGVFVSVVSALLWEPCAFIYFNSILAFVTHNCHPEVLFTVVVPSPLPPLSCCGTHRPFAASYRGAERVLLLLRVFEIKQGNN